MGSKKFERDLTIQSRIFSDVNFTHPSYADLFDYILMPETLSCSEFC